jgi:ubiquinone/menaquinone biosynthesis C-methylase UbiE
MNQCSQLSKTRADEQREAVRQFFDRDVDGYLLQRYLVHSSGQLSYLLRKKAVLEMLRGEAGSMLDVGCGPAVFTRELTAMGFWVASMAGIPGTRCYFTQGEISRLQFKSATFDCAICIGVLGYLLDPALALREVHRVLRPGGTAVVQISNRLSLTQYLHKWVRRINHWVKRKAGGNESPPFRLTSYTPQRFFRLLRDAGFRVEDRRFYDFNPPFLEIISPSSAMKVARRLNILGRSKVLGSWGEGLLVKVRSEK